MLNEDVVGDVAVLAQRVRHLQEDDGDDRQADEFEHAGDRMIERVAADDVGIDRDRHGQDQDRAGDVERLREQAEIGTRGAPGSRRPRALASGGGRCGRTTRIGPRDRPDYFLSQSRTGLAPAARIASM